MASIKLKGDTSGELTIQAPSVAGTNTLNLPASSGTLATTAQASIGMKNLIINGDMRVAQRGTSASGITTYGYYTVDKMFTNLSLGTWTISQDTDVPSGQGFANSLKLDCTTSASLSASSQVGIDQRLEGQNLQHLKFGTANAESLTVSFWVKSNKTGTYTTEHFILDDSRSISNTFTINSADTWEKKTITVVGDTVGVIDNDNGPGMVIKIWLAAGSDWTSGTLNTSWSTRTNANVVSSSNVNIADSTSNYFNITGVQLEVGTEATPFEHRPYDMEYQRCLRYYQQEGHSLNGLAGPKTGPMGMWYSTSEVYGPIYFQTEMRAAPTISSPTVTSGYRFHRAGAATNMDNFATSFNTIDRISCYYRRASLSPTGVAGQACWTYFPEAGAKIIFDAEL